MDLAPPFQQLTCQLYQTRREPIVGKDTGSGNGSFGFGGRGVLGCRQSACLAHRIRNSGQLVDSALFDRVTDKLLLAFRPELHGHDQRQCCLAFPQIVAKVFPHFIT